MLNGVIDMPSNMRRADLRITKTARALSSALFTLLQGRNFGKITVSDICEEALISRATFYAHFIDKYDFLERWLACFVPQDLNSDLVYDQIEFEVNQFIHRNEAILGNILHNMDNETSNIVDKCILSMLKVPAKNSKGEMDPQYIVQSNIYAGGILRYLLWQIDNKFPAVVQPMNVYLYDVINKFEKHILGNL